jgi:hypothetical protein
MNYCVFYCVFIELFLLSRRAFRCLVYGMKMNIKFSLGHCDVRCPA